MSPDRGRLHTIEQQADRRTTCLDIEIMTTVEYGECGQCGITVGPRYWSFDRYIEQLSYEVVGDGVESTVTVLQAEGMQSYCSDGCATAGIQAFVADRGLTHLYPGDGPIELCARCGKPVVMTKPHVAYVLLVGTEISKPWAISSPWTKEYVPESNESIAVLCAACEGPAVSIEEEVSQKVTALA